MTDLKSRYLTAKRQLFDRYYRSLNDRQREAVYHIHDPLLILAGAGSGKTTVLVRRIAYMIRFGNAYHSNHVPFDLDEYTVQGLEKAVLAPLSDGELEALLSQFSADATPPYRILAITFTNKAAGEMKSRLAAAFPDDPGVSSELWVGTFHSVCMRILRRHRAEAGLQDNFTVYDTDDSKKALQAVLKSLNVDDKVLPIKTVMNAISRAKDRLVGPENFLLEFGNEFPKPLLQKVYEGYQKRLAESNALDFDDIIFRTVRLLEENAEVRNLYQRRFRFVSVDEYQDTNVAQFRLTALLSAGSGNLMVVGDDDQSIYRFRGATIENIRNFTKVFQNATIIRLEQNYRSTQSILDAANAVISHNAKDAAMKKELWTDKGAGNKIRVLNPENQNAEARAIIDEIQKKVRAGREYRDFAVLFRTNAQSQALENAFARSGIPYRMLGGTRFSDRKEIRDIVAYLQLIDNHSDKERLLRIVNEPRRGLGDKTLTAVEEIANYEGISMFEVMEHADAYLALSRSAKTLIGFAGLINELTARLDDIPLDRFVDEVLDRTGYRQMIRDMGKEEADRLDNLEEFISSVIEYQESAEEPSLTEFLEITALVADVDRYDESADAVVLMTIHSAKGLEFPQVFLPGFEDGIFPGLQTVMAGPEEIEEERRLAYVAITRAKEELYILHAQNRMLYGRTSYNPASRFLSEIPENLIERPAAPVRPAGVYGAVKSTPARFGNSAATERTSMGRAATPQPAAKREVFCAGDRVKHATFGEGTILSVQKIAADTLYEIAFDRVGTKKMMHTYAKLQKM
ncbi:MAG: ATP-dependent DNA helicase PcrA [Ruminococcaceae bacterium]|nr:ATP-dependent DNA helicase PcrA [Oscillospiraceae bacterium]